MAKKTIKFWAVSPGDVKKKKLMASFVMEDGKLVDSKIPSKSIKRRVKDGFRVEKGKTLTLESDAVQFLDLLEGNYVMASYVYVETD